MSSIFWPYWSSIQHNTFMWFYHPVSPMYHDGTVQLQHGVDIGFSLDKPSNCKLQPWPVQSLPPAHKKAIWQSIHVSCNRIDDECTYDSQWASRHPVWHVRVPVCQEGPNTDWRYHASLNIGYTFNKWCTHSAVWCALTWNDFTAKWLYSSRVWLTIHCIPVFTPYFGICALGCRKINSPQIVLQSIDDSQLHRFCIKVCGNTSKTLRYKSIDAKTKKISRFGFRLSSQCHHLPQSLWTLPPCKLLTITIFYYTRFTYNFGQDMPRGMWPKATWYNLAQHWPFIPTSSWVTWLIGVFLESSLCKFVRIVFWNCNVTTLH